jgi:hypothetical protein
MPKLEEVVKDTQVTAWNAVAQPSRERGALGFGACRVARN